MLRWLVRITLALALLAVIGLVLGRWTLERQGAPIDTVAADRSTTAATVDAHGVPTIRARTWDAVLEAQGYYVASQRMFQMDLMRRAGSGRLAAWFGARALPLDKRRLEEDWPTVVARAYADLPEDERRAVDTYAAGVNRFIRERSGAWGLEYTLLRVSPEPWRGEDTLTVLLTMAEELSSSAPSEASEGRWREAMSDTAWADFIFTVDHPWNVPLFGGPPRAPTLPERALPPTPLGPDEGLSAAEQAALWRPGAGDDDARSEDPSDEAHAARADAVSEDRAAAVGASAPDPLTAFALPAELRALLPVGVPRPAGPLAASNSWAYCGEAGCFLANDPHLGYGVPELWVALVLQRVDDLAAPPPPAGEDWASGVAIPGIPGLVLGMNAHLAWAFTNTGEDVDDLLPETMSPDHTQYLARLDGETEVWAPLITRTATIEVKDQRPVTVTVVSTHRGPLLTREGLIVDHTRQWLPLKPGMLRVPVGLLHARSWEELNQVLDGMRSPAQNVVMLDRAGNIGYRTSGTGIVRRQPGRVPLPALEGEWLGFEPPEQRPRVLLPRTSTASPRFLATANQRIWLDDGGHKWADDARHEQLRRTLGASARLGLDDMVALQLDTESRFHRELLAWVRTNAGAPSSPEAEAMLARWAAWSGRAADDPRTFTEALALEKSSQALLLWRVRKHLLPQASAALTYGHRLSRGWLLTTLGTPGGVERFGLEPGPLAARLVEIARRVPATPLYPEANAWTAQHPFVATVPVIGPWFAISGPPQVGYRGVLRVEAPAFGASVRLVWKPSEPAASRWGFPIGQSGHIGSPSYDDARADWFAGRLRPVFR